MSRHWEITVVERDGSEWTRFASTLGRYVELSDGTIYDYVEVDHRRGRAIAMYSGNIAWPPRWLGW